MAGYVYAPEGTVVEYPVLIYRVRQLFPNISFPRNIPESVLAEHGVFPVVSSDRPVGDVITEIDPVLVSDVWTQQWSARAYTPEEQAEADAAAQEEAAESAVKADNAVRALLKATPDQIDSYIDTNVTDLASAKQVIATLAKAVSVLAQELLREDA